MLNRVLFHHIHLALSSWLERFSAAKVEDRKVGRRGGRKRKHDDLCCRPPKECSRNPPRKKNMAYPNFGRKRNIGGLGTRYTDRLRALRACVYRYTHRTYMLHDYEHTVLVGKSMCMYVRRLALCVHPFLYQGNATISPLPETKRLPLLSRWSRVATGE